MPSVVHPTPSNVPPIPRPHTNYSRTIAAQVSPPANLVRVVRLPSKHKPIMNILPGHNPFPPAVSSIHKVNPTPIQPIAKISNSNNQLVYIPQQELHSTLPVDAVESVVSPIRLLERSRSDDNIGLQLAKNLASTMPQPGPVRQQSNPCSTFNRLTPTEPAYAPVRLGGRRQAEETPKFCDSESGLSEQEFSFQHVGVGSRSRSRNSRKGIRVTSKDSKHSRLREE